MIRKYQGSWIHSEHSEQYIIRALQIQLHSVGGSVMSVLRHTCNGLLMMTVAVLLPVTSGYASINIEKIAERESVMMGVFYGESTLATRTPEPAGDAPGLLTVITREQMEKMGARQVTDVLRLIPSLQLSMSSVGFPRIFLRGIPSRGAERLKLLIDGHNVDLKLTGGGSLLLEDFPVDGLDRIEFLAGPGSALYGSDAMLGVLNLVTTRDSNDKDVSLTARGGSFDTQRYNVGLNKDVGALGIWGNFNYYKTNGPDAWVSADALSSSPVNSAISNAPGHTNEWVERTDVAYGFKLANFKLNGQYINHRDGAYYNPGRALTDKSRAGRYFFWTDLTFEDSMLQDSMDVTAKLLYNHYHHDFSIESKPPGFRQAGRVYPNGQHYTANADVEDYGLDFQLDYTGLRSHVLTVGAETWKSVLGQVKYDADFISVVNGQVADNWLIPSNRWYLSFFAQDQWNITAKLKVVTGLRFDHYDDVDDSVSPNVSLLYRFAEGVTARLQYGHAFRAPSFRELYQRPAGVRIVGDTSLEPEKADTLQGQIEWWLLEKLMLKTSAYYTKFKDVINTVFNEQARVFEFINQESCYTRGVDMSASYEGSTSLFNYNLSANISYADSTKDSREVPGIAHWTGWFSMGLVFLEYYSINMTCFYVGQQPLEKGDTRKDVPDYLLADLGLMAKDTGGLVNGLDAGVSVHNLFDTDYAYPELSGQLPDNMQRPGISAQGWLRYTF